MGNGNNEPIQFTRGDAERLKVIETNQNGLNTKVDGITKNLDSYFKIHATQHEALNKHVKNNSRFRKTLIRISLWIFSSGGGIGVFIFLAKQFGWLH